MTARLLHRVYAQALRDGYSQRYALAVQVAVSTVPGTPMHERAQRVMETEQRALGMRA